MHCAIDFFPAPTAFCKDKKIKIKIKVIMEEQPWKLRAVIVGSGASSSTPKLSCIFKKDPCQTCRDAARDPSSPNNRLNPCFLVQLCGSGGAVKNILFECGKTFRESALKVFPQFGVSRLDAVILSHAHADATFGLDDLREFTGRQRHLSVFADDGTIGECRLRMPYLFASELEGGTAMYVPQLDWKSVAGGAEFTAAGLSVLPIPVLHGAGYYVLAFAIATPAGGTLLYMGDVVEIPPSSMEVIKRKGPLEVLIIDMLSEDGCPTHFSCEQAIAAAAEIKAKRTFFVGAGHTLSYEAINAKLAAKNLQDVMFAGRDGLLVFQE